MKNYKKFLEEVSIKGNPAIPGGGEEKDWLKGVESEPREKAASPREIGGLVGRIMELLRKSNSFVAGKEAELSKLAEKIMVSKYGEMVSRYGVEFDIDTMDVYLGPVKALSNGAISKTFEKERARKYFKDKKVYITVDLKSGKASAKAWTCDFSKEYVAINSEYST